MAENRGARVEVLGPPTAVWTPAAGRSENDRVLAALDGVHGAARVVVGELSCGDLARALARSLATAVHAERTVVVATDEESLGALGAFPAEGERAFVPDEKVRDLLLQVAARRRTFFAASPDDELPSGGRWKDLGGLGGLGGLGSHGVRNALVLPALNHQGRAVAVLLALDRRGAAPFGPAELRAAETIALQAAVGFERALLLERLDDWSTGLEALLAFGAAVNRHLDPASLVRHLVEHAARFLKCSGGLAGLAESVDESAIEMVSQAIWHRAGWHHGERRFARGHGLAGFVLESEFPYLANDYPADPLAHRDLVVTFEVARAVCLPIKSSDEKVLGFFELHRTADQPSFSWQDVAFLESLANTTAVAIENARLLSDLESKGAEIRTLSAHNVTLLEDERQHIARELHDEAGQALVGVKLGLQVMARLVPSEMPELRDQLDFLRDQVNGATARIKDLARRLRPPTLDQLGLEVALRQLTTEYSLRCGFEIELAISPLDERPHAALGTAIYRIAQEALTNVASHAGAERVELSLALEAARLRLTIVDDGCGFDPSSARQGLGLLGIRERVGMLGGQLVVRSALGAGTRLEVDMPWGGEGG